MNKPNEVNAQWSWHVLGPDLIKRLGEWFVPAPHATRGPVARFRPAGVLLSLALAGLAVYWLAPQHTALEDLFDVIRVMSLGLVGLAGLAQIGSYLGSGYLLKVITDLGKARMSILRGTLITLGSASISVLPGGLVGSAVATYHWVSRSDNHPEEAALASLLPRVYNNVLLTGVAVIGLGFLLLTGQLSSGEMADDGLFLAGVGISLAIVLYSLYHQQLIERLILAVAAPGLRFLRRAGALDTLRDKIEHTFRGLALLRQRGWVRPTLGAALNIGFDMLSLYLLFLATGQAARLGIILAGYGLAFLLSKVAFLFPGGVGVVESGMTAIYTGLGVPPATSVVVVLSYRLFSFWIPILLGFAITGYLQHTSAPIQPPASSADPLLPIRTAP